MRDESCVVRCYEELCIDCVEVDFCELRLLGILGNSDAASKSIRVAAEKEPGCVIR